ncbi:MAG: PilZ domain-containing protein [Oscillospiraceae bacterium]|nr:PilZ domain-containing protein [Oscillospiraceae bacterium]
MALFSFGKKEKKPVERKGKLINTKTNLLAHINVESFENHKITATGRDIELYEFTAMRQVLFEAEFEPEKGFYTCDVAEVEENKVWLINLTPISGNEKRLFFRVGCDIPAEILNGDDPPLPARILDLSLGGAFIEVLSEDVPFRIDDKFTFTCEELGGDPITCLIVRQSDDGTKFGCRFERVNAKVEKHISTIITQIQRDNMANKVRV